MTGGTGGGSSSSGGPSSSGSSGSSSSGSSGSTSSSSSGTAMCGAGFTCVAGAAQGDYAVVGVCDTGWTNTGNVYDGADPGSGCPACACGAAQGGSCTPVGYQRWANSNCTGNSANHTGADNACVDAGFTGASGYFVPPWTVSQGACSAVDPAPVPVAVEPKGTLCTFAAAGAAACENGGKCVPDTASTVCVVVADGASCPSGWGAATTIYGMVTDQRTCACSCGGATGAACNGGSITLYDGAVCAPGNLLATYDEGSGCHNTAGFNNNRSVLIEAGNWQGGSCQATLQTGGAAQFGGPRTLCCP